LWWFAQLFVYANFIEIDLGVCGMEWNGSRSMDCRKRLEWKRKRRIRSRSRLDRLCPSHPTPSIDLFSPSAELISASISQISFYLTRFARPPEDFSVGGLALSPEFGSAARLRTSIRFQSQRIRLFVIRLIEFVPLVTAFSGFPFSN
jgi:hypothetical protein